ncbi:type I restriction-modification system subunit M [Phenylobacterium deserti]|uniref:site-specific DNA-methyltransferase (adenine-specific) n=1 Tax=Phenylobacterium deserti TaxID=1914756 RepID=A0A328A9L3_9CAUL|nr:type I restriction-modification system subunit M [Phenylobacterium deserti]RAK51310.1 type I restriction-modification system subunit M [Phenylobacterium deserti]
MTNAQKRQLQAALWGIANDLRGKMDADQFRDYILGFIFYRYLSERMQQYADRLLKPDGLQFSDIREGTAEGEEYLEALRTEAIDELGYFLRPSELFSAVAAKGAQRGDNFILDDLNRILGNIQRSTMGAESEEDFDHLFEDMDLGSTKLGRTVGERNLLVTRILGRLNDDRVDFRLDEAESDVLGDAYEYLIAQFASGAGKKAGEFYTPQQVSTVLAKIVTSGKTRLQNVYDPTCGSGSLLLRVAREVGIRNIADGFYGQEANRTTYNLARMNMILHGVNYRKFDIKQDDTLERPQHLHRQFEAVVANPPFSANWSADPHFLQDERFSAYGRLAPASKADFAFVLHMVHQLADNGVAAVILPHGALFRGGAEGDLRRILVAERNYLDAVIGLPPNIFYGTAIPTCVLVLKKHRECPEDILFVDASRRCDRGKNQNVLLDCDVDAIVEAYVSRRPEKGFCHRATLKEIEENDYNLNIPRYVDTFEPSPYIDLAEVTSILKAQEQDLSALDATIASFCEELGLEAPV